MFKVGDIVKFRASFLQSVGWYTEVPKNGRIEELSSEHHVKVDWNDGHGPTGVHVKNIMLDGKPDYSGL